MQALNGKGPLYKSVIWNAGVYFWFAGITKDIIEGMQKAREIIHSGKAKKTLQRLIVWRSQL